MYINWSAEFQLYEQFGLKASPNHDGERLQMENSFHIKSCSNLVRYVDTGKCGLNLYVHDSAPQPCISWNYSVDVNRKLKIKLFSFPQVIIGGVILKQRINIPFKFHSVGIFCLARACSGCVLATASPCICSITC